jgi:hypothetical protein
MPWRIDFEGEVYREGDLTLNQCGKVERITDRSWLHINPIKWAGDAVAILAVLHSERTGKPLDDIVSQVGQLRRRTSLRLVPDVLRSSASVLAAERHEAADASRSRPSPQRRQLHVRG